jgi:hypothetical protein
MPLGAGFSKKKLQRFGVHAFCKIDKISIAATHFSVIPYLQNTVPASTRRADASRQKNANY